jgi:hypothetical protein
MIILASIDILRHWITWIWSIGCQKSSSKMTLFCHVHKY